MNSTENPESDKSGQNDLLDQSKQQNEVAEIKDSPALVKFYKYRQIYKKLQSQESIDQDKVRELDNQVRNDTVIIYEEFCNCTFPDEHKEMCLELNIAFASLMESKNKQDVKHLSNRTNIQNFINNILMEYLISCQLKTTIDFCTLYPTYQDLITYESNKDFAKYAKKSVIDFCKHTHSLIELVRDDSSPNELIQKLDSMVHHNMLCIDRYKKDIRSMTKWKNNSLKNASEHRKQKLSILARTVVSMGFVGAGIGSSFGAPIVGAMIGAGASVVLVYAMEYVWTGKISLL